MQLHVMEDLMGLLWWIEDGLRHLGLGAWFPETEGKPFCSPTTLTILFFIPGGLHKLEV